MLSAQLFLLGFGSLALGQIQVDLKRRLVQEPTYTETEISNFENIIYVTELTIGEPGMNQTFSVQVDTGSQWTWVPDASCETCEDAPRYNSTHNSSDMDYEIVLAYAMGQVKCVKAFERVGLGQLVVDRQQIGLAVDSQDMSYNHFGGILGLGLPTSDGSSVLLSLQKQGVIDRAIYSLYLGDNQFHFLRTFDSNLIIGGSDVEHFSTVANATVLPIVTHVNPPGWWVEIDSIRMEGTKVVGQTKSRDSAALIDSGTSFILGPEDSVKKIWQEIRRKASNCMEIGTDDAPQLSCDCPNYYFPFLSSYFYDLRLTFLAEGDQTYTAKVTPDHYLIPNNGFCIVGISYLQNSAQWIFGDPFLRSQYTIFDIDNKTISLAPSKTTRVSTDEMWEYAKMVGIIVLVLAVCIGVIVLCMRRWCSICRPTNLDKLTYAHVGDVSQSEVEMEDLSLSLDQDEEEIKS